MCTVTFLPGKTGQYILTTSRDEQTSRPPAVFPVKSNYSTYTLLYPKDPEGGGTWIACNNAGKTACLFNGAFEAHHHQPPYRHSRGLVVLDLFKYTSLDRFVDYYALDNIEPFTLLVAGEGPLKEFKWDGERKHIMEHSHTLPMIWSSVTLYPPEIRRLRESWFEEWNSGTVDPSSSDILRFHLTAGDGDRKHSVRMERESLSLKTVSITSVIVSMNKAIMKYLDLINEINTEEDILEFIS